MDIDSPPSRSPEPNILSRLCIRERLEILGVPKENLEQLQPGLVDYVKNSKSRIAEIVAAILPTDDEAVKAVKEAAAESPKATGGSGAEDLYHESMVWLQWLMFEGDPCTALEHLASLNVGQRGVCGAVWGNNDIAYRCRTCEHDPTCAICVPCFQNGNHKDHDYSIIFTGGGCCDCGDVTAWKREGFCSKHRGAEQIQPLPDDYANSLGPVLDSLLSCWGKRLLFGETISMQSPGADNHADELKKAAEELTSAVVDMLLEFCNSSESLLSFISGKVFSSAGLLEVLVRAERFIGDEDVVRKLHELLLKLLGEPRFKYKFAKEFLSYYPTVVNEAIKETSDTVFKKYLLLSTFSVQIFTVPTLTPRLVKEMDLLAMLLECLEEIFVSCSGEDGRLQVAKWEHLYETTLRVVEDIRFVMSHSVVPRYVTRDRRDILRTWMKLLSFVQGMNPQKREIGIHVEVENENMHLPFVLGHSIANIHSLLVGGAFSACDETEEDDLVNSCKPDFEEQDSQRHAKVGRLSQESSVSSVTTRGLFDHVSKATETKTEISLFPPSVLWLAFECLRAIENWLGVDDTSGPLLYLLSRNNSPSSGSNLLALRRTLSKFRRGRHVFKLYSGPLPVNVNNKVTTKHPSHNSINLDSAQNLDQEITGTSGSNDSLQEGDYTPELEALRVLSLSDWRDIAYTVSVQDISVHIPLHRLLSIILQRALGKCYGESAASSLPLHHDFFGYVLGGCHPHGFSAFVMEHPLRIRVFCAQVHAGMWRKNGDAAILSYEWYRSVRWSEQGLELDLFMLQCCAALAPADLFVKRVLERFELSSYLLLNFEQSSEYESTLVQEMLTLIIQIVKERRFCGITSSECLQRELLYRLSIGDATRSQLVKSLPRDLSKIDKLQEVLDSIAVYSNPSGTNQGMYKLRKPYWKELDLYHPRWNSRDLQVAEERYMRFCDISALTTQLPKWTKIYPPLGGIARVATCRTTLQIIRASLIYAVFPNKANASRAPDDVLLTVLHLLSLALDICYVQKESGDRSCYEGDVIPLLVHASEEVSISNYGDQSLLSLLVLLLRKYQKENDFMETGNFNLSSLVESLLKKLAELEHGCMTKLQSLAPEMANQLLQYLPGGDVNGLGSLSDSDKRKAKARERQAAILEKMRAQQSKFLASIGSTEDAGADDSEFVKEESDADVGHASEEEMSITCSLCHNSTSKSPLSYLILLQKSRLLSIVDKGPPLWEQTRRSGKEPMSTVGKTEIVPPRSNISSSLDVVSSFQLMQLVQNAVNYFASEAQPREVERFMEFIKSQFPSVKSIQLPCTPNIAVEKMETSLFQSFDEYIYSLIQERIHHNISRLEFIWSNREPPSEQDSIICKGNIESFVLGKYIAALARETQDNPSGSGNEYKSVSESRKQVTAYDGFGPSDCDGIYLSSCGHAVHQGCLDRYLQSLKERYTRRIVFEGGHIVDLDQGEFLCPVCRGLANSVLPRLPKDVKMEPPVDSSRFILDSNCCLASSNRVAASLHIKEALSLLQSVADIAESCEILRALPMQEYGRSRSNLESVSSVLGGMYYPGSDKILKSDRLSPSLILYDTLKYSLMSTEVAARSRKTSLASNCTLGSLYKELKSSNGFILSLLLRTVNSTRTKNSLDVLIRLRGIQLLAVSICSSIFVGENPSNRCRGNMQEILKLTDIEVQYPDMQFWDRASDHILAHDAFSSLMWIIYCLPHPFLSCEETFLSLVHLFYAITVIQGIATYCKKQQCNLSELGHCDGLVTDVYKLMGGFRAACDYFDSNHIKTSCDITEAIRSLSFPYLRRCALLWKLIHSSTLVPFSEGSYMSDGLSNSTDEMMQSAEDSAEGLLEIEKLEKIFKIPPLNVVLNDEVLRFVVPKWFLNLSKEFQECKKPCVLYSTPAVPFRLMVLPHLYQDLLQRYIKQHCPDCGNVPEDPVLCLLCGKLCSPSWRTCCRQNSCQAHAMACGAGTGVFLLIRKTTILLQRSARQALWHSPYLDAFGEEDIDMHRGKPLYLNEERYAALTHMVASHGLDRSSKVLRQTAIGAFFML